MIGKDLTIHQFEHTKLIGHDITFSINPLLPDVSGRTIIAAQIETICLDRFHQRPQPQQVRIAVKFTIHNRTILTDASIQLLLDLCCLFISHKLHRKCHHPCKLADLFNISKRFLTVLNVCLRFHKFAVVSVSDDKVHRVSNSITQIILCHVDSMRCDNNLLIDYLRKLVSDRVGSILITTTKPNKITLNDSICARQIIKASVKNTRNFTLIERINLLMIVSDTNLFLVKDCFGSYKELTAGRVNTPDNCRGTVNLNAQVARIDEPIQNRQVTREDRIFGVLKVGVFHETIVRGPVGVWGGSCATLSTGTRAADLSIKKRGQSAPPILYANMKPLVNSYSL